MEQKSILKYVTLKANYYLMKEKLTINYRSQSLNNNHHNHFFIINNDISYTITIFSKRCVYYTKIQRKRIYPFEKILTIYVYI